MDSAWDRFVVNLKGTGIILFGLACILFPLVEPTFFIALGVLAWGSIAAYTLVSSLWFDPGSHLPWMVTTGTHHAIVPLIVLSLLGAIRGFRGSVAMLVCWFPFWIAPNFLLWTGLAANGNDWESWVKENYSVECTESWNSIDPAEKQGKFCSYTALPGRKLPSFTRHNDESITKVETYGG